MKHLKTYEGFVNEFFTQRQEIKAPELEASVVAKAKEVANEIKSKNLEVGKYERIKTVSRPYAEAILKELKEIDSDKKYGYFPGEYWFDIKRTE